MANTPHDNLFAEYVDNLAWAVAEVGRMRQTDFENLLRKYEGDRARAEEAFAAFGPLCADPYIIGAVREYWLKCDQLNRSAPASAVAPHIFILDRLRGVRDDLAEILDEYPYWPVGQDTNGRWV